MIMPMHANKIVSMKSKSIKYAFLALLAALSLLGCRKEFNEITELDLTRCLVPMELEASVAGGDQVTFSWLVTKEVESYTLQISENENFSPSLPDIKIAAADVPFTTQLTVDKTYYWRVKATSSKLEDSKWAKPEPAKASFDTYPVRPSQSRKECRVHFLGQGCRQDRPDFGKGRACGSARR